MIADWLSFDHVIETGQPHTQAGPAWQREKGWRLELGWMKKHIVNYLMSI